MQSAFPIFTSTNHNEPNDYMSGVREIPLQVIQYQEIEIVEKDEERSILSKKQLKYSVFIFANPVSGSNTALKLTKLQIEKMKFSNFTPKGALLEVFIYNLIDNVNRAKGESNIRIIVGGGDGTIMWVVDEMIKANIDFEKCPIAHLPFGTGNDFARVIGWGGSAPSEILGTNMNALKDMLIKWLNATVENFDIWEVSFEVNPEGSIQKVFKNENGYFKKPLTELVNGIEMKSLRFMKKMLNYFSVGIDARIGFGFDKSRTKSRTKNRMIYCWEGFKKLFIKTNKINSMLKGIRLLTEEEALDNEPFSDGTEAENEKAYGKYLILPKPPKGGKIDPNQAYFKDDPSVLLFLNIPSYLGGAGDIWNACKNKIGVIDGQGKVPFNFVDQKFNDDIIELLTYPGAIALAAERTFNGRAHRIGQFNGPIVIDFKDKLDDGRPIVTYSQIDGEFFRIISPKYMKIQKTNEVPNGRIKVMVNTNIKK